MPKAQPIDVIIGAGLETKTDPKLVKQGQHLDVVNAVQRKTGTLSKRYGTDSDSGATANTTQPIPHRATYGLYRARDQLLANGSWETDETSYDLLERSGPQICQYNEQSGKSLPRADGTRESRWLYRDNWLLPIEIDVDDVVRGGETVSLPSVAVNGDYLAIIWDEVSFSSGERDAFAQVLNRHTMTPVSGPVRLGQGVDRPQVVASGSYFGFFFVDTGSNDIYVSWWDVSDQSKQPTDWGAAVAIDAGALTTGANHEYDVSPVSDVLVGIVYKDAATGFGRLARITGGSTLTFDDILVANYVVVEPMAVWRCVTPDFDRTCAWFKKSSDSSGNLSLIDASTLATPTVEDTAQTSATGATEHVTGSVERARFNGSSSTPYYVRVWEGGTNQIAQSRHTLTASALGASVSRTMHAAILMSKAVEIAGRSMIWASLGSAYSTLAMFLVTSDFRVAQDSNTAAESNPTLARVLQGWVSGPRRIKSCLAGFVPLDDGGDRYIAACLRSRTQGESDELWESISLLSLTVTRGQLPSTEALGQLYLGGGTLQLWDGRLQDPNVLADPVIVSAVATSVAGAGLADGTYSWKIVWEWNDSQGRTHRSAPSLAKTLTLSTTLAATTVEVTYASLPFGEYWKTNIPGATSGVLLRAVLYRTTAGGTTYYRTGSTNLNSGVVASLSITDDKTDAQIVVNEALYTPAELDTAVPNGVYAMAQYDNRLAVIPMDDRNVIWHTHELVPGFPAEFSEFLTKRIEGEPLVAVFALDSQLICASANQLKYYTGSGPNRGGGGGNYSQPQLLSSDVGVTNWRSVARVPDGYIFQAASGWHILNRSMQVTYLGQPDEYKDQEVLAAIGVDEDKHVRWLLDDNTALVYDYLHDAWSRFVDISERGVNWGGGWAAGRSGGGGFRFETKDHYLRDGRNLVSMTVDTGWVAVGGVLGLQSISAIDILGVYKSPHTLVVDVYTDYSETAKQTVRRYVKQADPYLLRITPSDQQATALRVRIKDEPNHSGSGEGCTLSTVRFWAGVENGRALVPEELQG